MAGHSRQAVRVPRIGLKRIVNYPNGHKLTLSIFGVLAVSALIPFPLGFFAIFTHWHAFVLTFTLQDLAGITPADIRTPKHDLFVAGVQFPILMAYSFGMAIWIGFIFSNIGGRRHRAAAALAVALVLWVAMPFIISGMINQLYYSS